MRAPNANTRENRVPAKKAPTKAPNANTRENRTPIQGALQTKIDNTPAPAPVTQTPPTPPIVPQPTTPASTPTTESNPLNLPQNDIANPPTGATVAGAAYLGADNYYYYPMSDGTTVKGAQGTSLAKDDVSATQTIQDLLATVGLKGLAMSTWTNYKAGDPASKLMNDIRATPEYSARFPGMAALVKKGEAINEASYIAHETQARELMQTYLGPAASKFATVDELGKLIANQVSPVELQSRLQAANDAVLQADPKTVQWLKDQGLTQGDLNAFWLNPEVAMADIQRRANMGQLGGVAQGAGVGINAVTADQLARQGTTLDQAKAGFGRIGLEGQLQQNLPGDTTGSVTQQDLINATFNNDAVAQQKIARVQQGRTAQFQDGGNFATDSKGVSGLGVAATQ